MTTVGKAHSADGNDSDEEMGNLVNFGASGPARITMRTWCKVAAGLGAAFCGGYLVGSRGSERECQMPQQEQDAGVLDLPKTDSTLDCPKADNAEHTCPDCPACAACPSCPPEQVSAAGSSECALSETSSTAELSTTGAARCPVCGQVHVMPVVRAHGGFPDVDMVECPNCGFFFANPMPTTEFLTEFYHTEYGKGRARVPGQKDHLYNTRAKEQTNFIGSLLSTLDHENLANGTTLDIGCNEGQLVEASAKLLKNVRKAMGFELDDVARKYAQGRFHNNTGLVPPGTQVEITDTVFGPGVIPDESLAMITSSHVLEHLPDPEGYLRATWAALKEGGILFTEVPMPQYGGDESVNQHLHYFTPHNLALIHLKTGYQVLGLELFNGATLLGSTPGRTRWPWGPGLQMRIAARKPKGANGHPLSLSYMARR